MTTLREAAQQALEALEYENSWHKPRNEKPYASTLDAITALRAALAEPLTDEQISVLWHQSGEQPFKFARMLLK